MCVCLVCGWSHVQSSRPATFFRGDKPWNNFYGHFLPLIKEGHLSVTGERMICQSSLGAHAILLVLSWGGSYKNQNHHLRSVEVYCAQSFTSNVLDICHAKKFFNSVYRSRKQIKSEKLVKGWWGLEAKTARSKANDINRRGPDQRPAI